MPPSHTKPSVEEVHEFLAHSHALIVHFSGSPPGSGMSRSFYFPEDLKHVIAGNAMGGLSCSLVKPGDVFHGVDRQSTGTVGVIVDLSTPESLIAVAPKDVGSYVDAKGRRHFLDQDISIQELQNSLAARDRHYNEWGVREYLVKGLFIAPPIDIWGECQLEVPNGAQGLHQGPIFAPIGMDVQQILEQFPGLDAFRFHGGRIINVRSSLPVSHADIY